MSEELANLVEEIGTPLCRELPTTAPCIFELDVSPVQLVLGGLLSPGARVAVGDLLSVDVKIRRHDGLLTVAAENNRLLVNIIALAPRKRARTEGGGGKRQRS
jgi:hypothetical protein